MKRDKSDDSPRSTHLKNHSKAIEKQNKPVTYQQEKINENTEIKKSLAIENEIKDSSYQQNVSLAIKKPLVNLFNFTNKKIY